MNSTKTKNRIGMFLAYMGGSPVFLLISSYLVYYYTNVAGLNAAIVGTILLVSRVLDGVSDVVFGNMIDRTRTKMGVCRPWVFRMAIFGVISLVALFTVPHFNSDFIQYAYVFVTYNFANTIVATIYQLAIITLPSYLERDSQERNIIYIFANTGQALTQVLISSVMFKAVMALGGTQKAWTICVLIISAIGCILDLIAVSICKETVDPDEIAKNTGDEAKVPFGKAVKACIENKYWWMILAFVTFGTAANVATMTMTSYYSQYILGNTAIADILNTAYSFPMLVIIPFLSLVVGKVGKRNIALFGAFLIGGGALMTVLVPNNLTLLCIATVLKSIGMGCPSAVYAAMLTDAIEYGQWKTGVRNQAVLIGAQSAGGKIGVGLASAFLSWAMAWTGFDGMAAVQTAAATSCIAKLFGIFPIVMAVLMIVILFNYDLDKRFPQIMADLKAREESGK